MQCSLHFCFITLSLLELFRLKFITFLIRAFVFWHKIQSSDIVRAQPFVRYPSLSFSLSHRERESLILQLRGSNANYNGARKNVLYPSFVFIIIISDQTQTHSFSFIQFCCVEFFLPLLKTHFIVTFYSGKERRKLQSVYCCLRKKNVKMKPFPL